MEGSNPRDFFAYFEKKLLFHSLHRTEIVKAYIKKYMLDRWNQKVRKNDEVVIIGDLSWGKAEETNELLDRLNGRLYLIQGNHD